MRFTIVVLFTFAIVSASSVLAVAPAEARCGPGHTSSYPKSKVDSIPSNATVIITMDGIAQDRFSEGSSKTYFFTSGKHRVPARIVEVLHSEFRLTALKLQATKALRPGKRYSLRAAGKRFSWKVSEPDNKAPKWQSGPKIVDYTAVRYGCGPAENFELSVGVVDNSEVYFDVELLGSSTQHFYVQQTSPGTIMIGHGMCSGAFVLPKNETTRARITPYDSAGNRGVTKIITLQK